LLVLACFAPLSCGSSGSGEEPGRPDASADASVDVAEGGPGPADMGVEADSADNVEAEAEASAPPKPLAGLYALQGADTRWGAYTGQAEIRADGAVSHVHAWTEAEFEGDTPALAWEGTAKDSSLPAGPYELSFRLARVGFIQQYKGESHKNMVPAVVGYQASCQRTAPASLSCKFTPDVEGESVYEESWTWVSEPGEEPLWKNERETIKTHPSVPDATKAALFQTYATYHELPELQPYLNRPEFKEAVHYQVFDPTDFAFYRANPKVLRSLQKVPDVIGLVETRMRNRAYRQTFEQKRQYFEQEMPLHHLNSAGMVVDYLPGAQPPGQWLHSGDSTLWTGVYVASQAMRHLMTKEQQALENMLTGLRGLILCFDIAGKDGEFARTIREHQEPLGDWVQGTGAYAAYDWMTGCNNDMLQGYYVGFAWAWMVLKDLPGYAAEKQKMPAILDNLVKHFPVAGDKKDNELKARMLLFWMTNDLNHKLLYEGLWQGVKYFLVDQGNGAFWEYGTSDWSGNHLIIQGLLVPYLVSSQVKDGHLGELKEGMRKSVERMRHTRLGLYQMIGATLGDFSPAAPELEQSLWVLREFPSPKVEHDYDWRIHPQYCMSPFPSLPWKNDWTTTNRLQSLTGYPLFEKVPDIFAWKQGPFGFRRGESPVQSPGMDYLFAYWFGRYYGVVTPEM
jgi:hypothetical protein